MHTQGRPRQKDGHFTTIKHEAFQDFLPGELAFGSP